MGIHLRVIRERERELSNEYQDLDTCALDESSLSIGRVEISVITYWSRLYQRLAVLVERHVTILCKKRITYWLRLYQHLAVLVERNVTILCKKRITYWSRFVPASSSASRKKCDNSLQEKNNLLVAFVPASSSTSRKKCDNSLQEKNNLLFAFRKRSDNSLQLTGRVLLRRLAVPVDTLRFPVLPPGGVASCRACTVCSRHTSRAPGASLEAPRPRPVLHPGGHPPYRAASTWTCDSPWPNLSSIP